MKVHLIHGIRTGPESPVKGLIPYLHEFDVRYVDYGYELAAETRLINPMIVGTILPYVEDGDICVCHSNGCAIGYDLASRGAMFVGAVYINGALDQTFARHAHIRFVTCYWNEGDSITEIAKIGEEFGIYPADWGQLGHTGYLGADPAIVNVNCGATPGMPKVDGHSDFFSPAKLAAWGPYLAKDLKQRLGGS